MINIYDVNGKVLMQAEITSSAIRVEELSKSDYISLSWNSAEKVILPAGAYIVHKYKIDKVREVIRHFLLFESYEPTQSDEMSWKYTPEFQHPKMILSKIPFFIRTRNSKNEVVKQYNFNFFGTMATIADRLKDFLNNELKFGNAGWVINYDTTNTNAINVSFSDNDFMSALTAITNAIGDNCEWHIDYDNETIHIGNVLRDDLPIVTLKVGENVGIPSITNSKEDYYNAFAVFGGTRNITQVNDKGENISSSDIKLQLSKGSGTTEIDGKKLSYSIDEFSTIDMRQNKNEQLFTKILNFAQIYPSLNTYLYNVRGREKYVLQDGNKIPLTYNADGSVKTYKTFTVWYVRMAYPTTEKIEDKKLVNTTVDNGVTHYWYDFEVSDDLLINGKNIGCSFEANFNEGALSTPLAGRGTNGDYVGFELTYHKEASSTHTTDDVDSSNFAVLAGDFEIIYQEDNDLIIPTNAKDMIIPKGESLPSYKCNITVLYNIAMAESIYTEDAQKRLLDAAMKEIKRLLSDLNNYSVKSYPQVFEAKNPCLQIGQKVVYDDGNGYQLNTRAQKISTNIDFEFVQEITVGNEVIKGNTAQLKEDVKEIIASGGSGSGGGGNYTTSQLKNLIGKYGTGYFVSKLFDDTAEGLITFAKGLIAKGLADLMMGAKFGNNAKITELGEAFFSAIKSLDYDNAAEQGFSVEKEKNGKYHAFFTNLTIWGKAIFHEIEVRKLSYSGGNIYLSGAGSKLIKVVPVKQSVSADGATSWVEMTKDDAESECAGWKCYLLADDGTTATMNDWQDGDQARCQTMGEIVAGGTYTDASNKSYWRTIPKDGVSTQNEKIYGTKTETYIDEDGNEQTREVQVELYDGQAFAWIVIGKHGGLDGYDDEFGVGYKGLNPAPLETRDVPSAGDTIVLDGNRHRNEQGEYDKTDRQNVIILETTGEYAPRIACYANITEYKHTITKSVNNIDKEVSLSVFETSPKGGTKINSSRFEWISDDGSTINIINYRGDWDGNNTTYHKNDQVNHNNAVWVCIANSGVDVTEEPSEGSSYWKKVLSGGKGDKGDDAVSYGIQFSERITTISSVETKVLDVRFIKSVGQQITSGSIKNIGFNGSCVVYIDGVMNSQMSNMLNSGQTYLDIYHAFADEIKGKKGLSVELLNSDAIVVASNTFSFVESGEGVVMAYKNATSRPSEPTVEDLSQLSDGWSRTPQKGGSYEKVSNVSYGNYSAGNTDSGYSTSEWSEVSDSGEMWRKSPAGLGNYGWALMKVSFTTNVDNSDVKFIIKAYSEYNCDFIQVHALDTEITGSPALRLNGVFNESGNGVESTHSFTSVKAGQHFFYVSYCKDVSINSNGDYGLFRFDLSDNLASMPSTVWMSQAVLKEGKAVLPWSTPVQITGDDAYRVEVSPATLVFDTNENGLVDTLSGKYATVTVYKGNQKISTDNLSLPSNHATKKYTNVDGKISNVNGEARITIDSIGQETISGDVTVSKSSGQISFPIDVLGERSTLMWVTVNVQVNVSKFTGSVAFDNKGYKAQFDELSNGGGAATKNELKDVTSTFEQTAREISLSVSEKSIGRRNLLVGSAFLREDNNRIISNDARIEMNSGYQGTNCIHVIDATEAGNPHYVGAYWDGSQGGRSIKIEKGKKYTMSCFCKTNDINAKFYLEAIYTDKQENATRKGQAKYLSPNGHTVKKVNEWELFTTVVDTTDAEYDYIAFNFWEACNVAAGQIEAWICRPMVEEGDTYNGWTLSQDDYDYIGGNMLDNTLSLDKSGSLYDVNGTLTPAGFGESTSIYKSFVYKLKGTVDSFSQLPSSGNVYNDTYFVRNEVTCYVYNGSEFIKVTVNDSYYNILEWRKGKPGAFTPFGLEANKDYVFSFMAKGTGVLTAYFYNPETDVFIESSLGATGISVDGGTSFQLTNKWERYWVHWRPSDSLHKYVLLRLNRSFQSDGSAPVTDCYIAQPKLEEGARVTEYTERKSDLVDKASLKAAGIVVDSESVTLYGNQVHIKKNKTDANDTVLIDNKTGKVSAGLIDADKVVAEGIRAKNLEATNLNVTGNSKFGIWEIRKDDTFGEMIQARGDLQLPSGHTVQGSGVQYLPLYIRGGLANVNYFRVGVSCTEFSYSYNGRDFCGVWTGKAADYVCGSVANTAFNTPTEYGYDESYHPAEYIYTTKSLPNDPAFAINVQKPEGTAGERTAIQTNAAIRGVLAPNSMSISWNNDTIPSGIGVVICTNGSEITLTLPANPIEGQTLIIIQGSDKRVYIVPYGDEKIYCSGQTRDKSNKFFSGMIGQFNIFVFIRGNWQLQFVNNRA